MGQERLLVVRALAQGAHCHCVGDVLVGGGVQDGAHGQRVGGALDEQPVSGGQRRAHGGVEAHGAALVAHPVPGVHRPWIEGVVADGGVEHAAGRRCGQGSEDVVELVEDGVDLGGV